MGKTRTVSSTILPVVGSSFFLSGLIFVVLNLALAHWRWAMPEPLAFPEKGWAGWAITDFLRSSDHKNLVFLGSSLMLVPLAGCDADLLQCRLDGSQHHECQYFQTALKERTGADIRTFDFALPGEMPSDAYLIMDYLLKGKQLPEVIVYGVGPRDFIDNELPSPSSTDPFRQLCRFGPIERLSGRVRNDWVDRFGFELSRACYLYRLREDLSNAVGRFLDREVVGKMAVSGEHPFSFRERRVLLPNYRASELFEGEAFFRPQDQAEQTLFSGNLSEYRKRYRTLKWDTFLTQTQFYADLLRLARQRGVHVVVVAMPLTDLNRSLLQSYAWSAYIHSVRVLARLEGATLVDLSGSSLFSIRDFMDTVHLNSAGGRKMLDKLADSLSRDSAVRLALKLTEKHRLHLVSPAVAALHGHKVE